MTEFLEHYAFGRTGMLPFAGERTLAAETSPQ